LFSLDLYIAFVDVQVEFKQPNITNTQIDGYTFMCRFNYFGIWKYLDSYDYAIRVDDDCLLRNEPVLKQYQIFGCVGISDEAHEKTNETLPPFLKKHHLSIFYDHKFPYTNLYITKLDFWRQRDVQEFLGAVAATSNSYTSRWGDLPILGVALKAFGSWEAEQSIIEGIEYMHLSHHAYITEGKINFLQQESRTKLYLRFFKFYFFKDFNV